MIALRACLFEDCHQFADYSPWWQADLCPGHLSAVDQHQAFDGAVACSDPLCRACHCWRCQERGKLERAVAVLEAEYQVLPS